MVENGRSRYVWAPHQASPKLGIPHPRMVQLLWEELTPTSDLPMFKWFKQTNDKDDMPNTVVKAVTIVRALER